jgi:protein-tyrosine phosphatase
MNSVDLHFHLLPGVDDGPTDLAETIELARAAVADGSRIVVATPHVRPEHVTDVLGLREVVREVRAGLSPQRVPLEVVLGGELGHEMVGRLRQEELEAIAQGPPGARWLLVEMPFEGVGDDFHAATAELRDRGFGVLVAHPERSADALLDRAAGLRRELAAGSLAQITALSLTGAHGPDAERAGYDLIRAGLVAVVASDAHGPSRPPSLSAARRALADRGMPSRLARTLTISGPHGLLARGIAPAQRRAA